MINVSNAFRRDMQNGNRRFQYEADITLKDGTVLNIDNSKIWDSGVKFSEATSTDSNFDIGIAVTGKLSLTLNNIYDEYSDYNFSGATVDFKKIALKLSNGTTEGFAKGVYTVVEPSYDGSTITLECLDNMCKFDKPYSLSELQYPATLRNIVQDACNVCGVQLVNPSFDFNSYTVNTRPTGEDVTFTAVIAMVCQIACLFPKITYVGALKLDWYAENRYQDMLDGGTFRFTDGDNANGSNFQFNESTSFDGGTFADKKIHSIYQNKSVVVNTDDTIITGVRVLASESDDMDAEDDEWLEGNEGYVIDISENQLIDYGQAQTVAQHIASKCVGMRFRGFSISCLSDPTYEAGDLAFVYGKRDTAYFSYVTSVEFHSGNESRVSCGSASVEKNSARTLSSLTKLYLKTKKKLKKERTERQLAVDNLSIRLDNSNGMYYTQEQLEDGSTITYVTDKPTIDESNLVIKVTAEAIGISNDGGSTYPYGITLDDANAILNKIYAVGIDASYIKVQATDANGNPIEMPVIDYVSSTLDPLSSDLSLFKQNIQMDDNGITMLAPESDTGDVFAMMLNAGKLSFTLNGEELAYYAGKQFVIGEGVIQSKLTIGNFYWQTRVISEDEGATNPRENLSLFYGG